MTKVYLDNNIFVYIEDGKLHQSDLITGIDSNDSTLLYSAAHLQETKEISSANPHQRKKWIEQRIETISQVTNNKYLYHELPSNDVYILNKHPEDVLKTISEVDSSNSAMRMFINLVGENQKQEIREQMGLEKGKLNNKSPNEVIVELNKKLAPSYNGQSMLEIIESTISLNRQGHTFGLHNRIGAIFEILDMLGYWTDKHNEKSNYARLWDSNHTYFGSFCDYFISDDKRTRNKAKVVYDIYGIETKILSSKEVIE